MGTIRKSPLPGHLPGGGVTQPADDARNATAVAEKKRLRPLCLARRESLTQDERAAADDALCGALLSSPLWQTARLICLYVPMRGEPALDKRIALPVCGTARSLSFRLMPGYGAMFLRPGPYGTQEPTEDCLPLPLADLDGALMLVPGLSFDGDGYRLGYGGGYYDTLLYTLAAHGIAPITVGVTYASCLAPGAICTFRREACARSCKTRRFRPLTAPELRRSGSGSSRFCAASMPLRRVPHGWCW